MSRGVIHVLLAEDHVTTRLGVRHVVQEEFKPVVFGEAGDGGETLMLLSQQRWDLLILDISLPDRSGLELLPEIKRLQPSLPVLIFSAHPEDQFAVHALRAQAAGYLTKERAAEELGAAIRTLLSGGKYVSSSLTSRRVPRAPREGSGQPHDCLSEREFQVLRSLAAGLPGKVIAAELGLSEKTVSTYRTRVLKKLHFDTTAEIIQYAVRHGLV